MAIKNTKLGGVDVSDEQITDYDFNDTIDATANICESDQTAASMTGQTEAMIGEVILDAATAINGVIVIATGKCLGNSAGGATGTIKLYSGTNAAFGSNNLRKTITRSLPNNAFSVGWSMVFVLTSEEVWTGSVYIQVTGDSSGSAQSVACESVVVMGIGGTN